MRRILWTLVVLIASAGPAAAQRVRVDNLPSHVIVDSCSGCGGASGPIAIDQTTPGTTNGVAVTNVPHIVCDSGCGSPPATPDTAAFTAGVTSASITAGVYDDTMAALSAGISAAYRMTAARALHSNLRNAAGTEIGTALTPLVTTALAKVNDGPVSYAENDLQPLHIASDGALNVAIVNSAVGILAESQVGDFAAVHLTDHGVSASGGFFDDTSPGALTENQSGSLRISSNRNLYGTLRDAAGNERGANVSAANALKVDGSAVTQPVSLATLPALAAGSAVIGHVIADTGSTTAVTALPALPAGTNNIGDVDVLTLPALVAGSAVIGHVIVDTTSTTAVTQATGTNLHAVLDTGSTTAVTQATGTNLHAVIDTGSTTAVTQATAANLNAQIQGAAASGAAKAGNPVQIGGVFNTTQPTVTNGQEVEQQNTARGAQIVATGVDTFNVTVNAALPAGTNVLGHVIVDTTSTTAVTQATAANLNAAVVGTKTNNNAAPGATNIGAIDALATAAPQAWTEGNQVAHSVDLAGNLRVALHPPAVLGCYAVNANAAYTATTQNGIIFSFRWADATRLAFVYRVTANVVATAFTTVGLVERQLIVVRSFTASDTGGTAVTPAANNAELRTSFGTSLATDLRVGGFLTAGTGTADANPLASVASWMPAAGTIIPMTDLFDARGGTQYPIVLAQNEGFRIRLGAAETASTRQTFVNVVWCESAAF